MPLTGNLRAITALRGLAAMPLVCLYIAWRREMGTVFSPLLRWRLHLLRGVLSVVVALRPDQSAFLSVGGLAVLAAAVY